jgi:acyl-[acyl-carrier-protein] desaturase
METPAPILPPELEIKILAIFREFFDRAERKRRWKIADDIPWDECNPKLDPVVADVVETFTAIELYLPDYNSKIIPKVRHSKGRTWFYASWGYEESKHSLALGDWLLKSGHRSDEYMADLEKRVFEREWNLPHDNHLGMLCYAMVQEQATFLNYRNLRSRTAELGGCPCLEKLLGFVSVDEKAHYTFFRDCLSVYMEYDRAAVIEQLRRVLSNFQMPAIHDLLDESHRRLKAISDLQLINEEIYYGEVYLPVLAEIGVTRNELRSPLKAKKSSKHG